MVLRGHAIEQGSASAARWLRENRLRLALWIAVVEGVFIVADMLSWWGALIIGVSLVGFYVFAGRNLPDSAARELSWVGAASQLFVALVPVLVAFLWTLAVVAVVVLAIVAAIFLFTDRR